ncbi:MAG: ribosome small subunit-dependent GTPase A [Acholeplasmatales bacterium]|jgi:ribosome biogenesis GTPase|nr:ribosome small subunit-dependent GTPase A [Acholeplasmatales bacterium]
MNNTCEGLIIYSNASLYRILLDDTKEVISAKASGILRYQKLDALSSFNKSKSEKTKKEKSIIQISPKVGDKCIIETNNGINYIKEIKERKSSLVRPDVANIDISLILFSATAPVFSFVLLDQFLLIMKEKNIKPVLVVSKIDLVTKSELDLLKEQLSYYNKYLDLDIFYVNSKQSDTLLPLRDIFKGKITVITGQTGTGKSTMLNALSPSLELKTSAISVALGRGKHTTRHYELFNLFDGFICDTPGFSKIELSIKKEDELKDYYDDFVVLSKSCKFGYSCKHTKEIGCNVINEYKNGTILKSRYDNYIMFYEKMKERKKIY